MVLQGYGDLLETDDRIFTGDDGPYMRAKLRLDISRPLRRGATVQILDEKIWIDYTFERIPTVCAWCACITHTTDECMMMTEKEKEEEEQGFGPWLTFKPPPKKRPAKKWGDNDARNTERDSNSGGRGMNHSNKEEDSRPATNTRETQNTKQCRRDSPASRNNKMKNNGKGKEPVTVSSASSSDMETDLLGDNQQDDSMKKGPTTYTNPLASSPREQGSDEGNRTPLASISSHDSLPMADGNLGAKHKVLNAKRKTGQIILSPNPKEKLADRPLSSIRFPKNVGGLSIAMLEGEEVDRDRSARISPNDTMAMTVLQSRQSS